MTRDVGHRGDATLAMQIQKLYALEHKLVEVTPEKRHTARQEQMDLSALPRIRAPQVL